MDSHLGVGPVWFPQLAQVSIELHGTRTGAGMGVGSNRRVTSADVARSAQVSRATVSYVLNNTPHQKIPEATRVRVLEAANRLGYLPSAAARALASGRTNVVLCLLPDIPTG